MSNSIKLSGLTILRNVYLFVVVLMQQVNAQDTSFQMLLDGNVNTYGSVIYVSQDGDEMYLLHTAGPLAVPVGFNLVPLFKSTPGGFTSYEIGNDILFSSIIARNYYLNDDNLFVALGPISTPISNAFLKVNLKDGIAILKDFPVKALLTGSYNDQSIVFVASFGANMPPSGNTIGIQFGSADLDLDIQWVRYFEFSSTANDKFESTSPLAIASHPSGNYYVLGNYVQDEVSHSFVIKFNESGNVLSTTSLGTENYNDLKAATDGVYLIGSVDTIITDEKSDKHLLITKLDLDLNPVWSHIYFAESFKLREVSFSLIDKIYPVFAYSTNGYFPTILAKLDQDGQIIEQKGYPLYYPKIEVLPDGSLVQLSVLWNQGNVKTIVSKTKADGSIEGCPVFPTCLNYQPRSIISYPLLFSEKQYVYNYTGMQELTIDSMPVDFVNYCDIPPAPSPDFVTKDTICLSDTIVASGTLNENAHGTKWTLLGPGLDTSWIDFESIEFVPEIPGEYMLIQSVWYLGCRASDTSIITVLPPLSIALESEKPFCKPSVQLLLTSPRPLTSLTWSTGATTPAIDIDQGGHYSVTATDGYCTDSAGVDVVFVSETLGGQPALELPADTTVCRQHLPYLLSPHSAFTDSFQVNGRLYVNDAIELVRADEYEVAALIDGCAFVDTFRLDTSACHVKVYFPTAFSPNGDGINDGYRPLAGDDVEMLELWIFDRWGGMRYHSTDPQAAWDGEEAPAGTYVAKLKFKNLLTGLEEIREGGFTLMR